MKVKYEIEKSVLLKIYLEGGNAESLCNFMRDAFNKVEVPKHDIALVEDFIVNVEQALTDADYRSAKKE